MSDRNLPAVPGKDPFTDRPGAVRVISHNDIPPIVARMQRVQMADETLALERDRYSTHSPLTVLHANEKAAMAAMDALEEGRVLIDLDATIRRAGMDNNMPRLAIVRPRCDQGFARVRRDGNHVTLDYAYFEKKPGRRRKPFFRVSKAVGSARGWFDYVAATPPIPVEIRADHPYLRTDDRYLVLWEPEWTLVSSREIRPPHIDPALLYRVSGALYAVVAVWDLTAVEQAALKPGPKF